MESCLYAADLAAAEAFYHSILGLEVIVREEGRHVFFRCGTGVVLLFNPEHTAQQATQVNGSLVPLHGSQGAGHLAFKVAPERLEEWRQHLRTKGVAIESEVDWPKGGRSLYFRDPAGNSLELVTPETWREGPSATPNS